MPISDLSLSFLIHIVIFLPPFMMSNSLLYLGHFIYCRTLTTIKAPFQQAVALVRYRMRVTCARMCTCPVDTNNAIPQNGALTNASLFQKDEVGSQSPLRTFVLPRTQGTWCCVFLPQAQGVQAVFPSHFKVFLFSFVSLYPGIWGCKRENLGGMPLSLDGILLLFIS